MYASMLKGDDLLQMLNLQKKNPQFYVEKLLIDYFFYLVVDFVLC